jgi:hypothetical protein
VGVVSLAALLYHWTGSRFAAATGSCIYAFAGYFAVVFVAGHVTFAFFHLVPLLMLLSERSFAAARSGRRQLGACALSTFAAFALFSGGLPHALFHFYPAAAALLLLRVGQTAYRSGLAPALRAGAPVAAHALGLWLAVYKLWPVMRWQMQWPREHVYRESRSLLALLDLAGGFVPGFLGTDLLGGRDPFRLGASAYLGPLPWLLAAIPVLALVRRRSTSRGPGARAPDRLLTTFGLALVLAGLALALGNANPWSPAAWFAHIPFLAGVRGFGRYEILSIFGVALLATQALASLGRVRVLLAALAAGPLLLQAGLLAWRIPAVPNAALVAHYDLDPHPDPPEFVSVPFDLTGLHRTALLEEGYWISNCYENLSLPVPPVGGVVGTRLPLSSPPPASLETVGPDRLRLRFDAGYRGWIHLRLPVLDGFEFDAPVRRLRNGRASFRASDLDDHRLTIRAHYAGPREGLVASLLGSAACAVFYGGWAVRRRRTTGPRSR